MVTDPRLITVIRALGELHGAENVARIAGTLADPGPVKALADAAAEVLRIYDHGSLDLHPEAMERLRFQLYGGPDGRGTGLLPEKEPAHGF